MVEHKQTNSVGANTYQQIKHDIIFGDLAPGVKLKLDPLKQRYEASLSTLRETLNRLSSEGFILAEEQRGFFVAPISKEDLIEVTNLRILLECHALKASIQLGDANWEGGIVAAHHKLHTIEKQMLAGDHSQKKIWKKYDSEFHFAMIRACQSKNLLVLHSVLFDKYLRYQMLILTHRGATEVDEHKDMLQAALDRNEKKAQEILTLHIEHGLNHALSTF